MPPRLLYLSPKIPRGAGHGTAMRAGLHVRLLAEMFEVSLVVVTEEPGASAGDVPDAIRDACSRVLVSPADDHMDAFQRWFRARRSRQAQIVGRVLHPYPYDVRMYNRETRRLVAAALAPLDFDAIHAFRLHMAPLALTLAGASRRRPRLLLDLDVYESEAARRQAELMRGSAGLQWYWLHRLEAAKYAFWERRCLGRFEQLWVCSDEDRLAMSRRYGASNVHTVRNGFEVPAALPPAREDGVFTFLFVGTMSYFANEDGVLFFCREVLPLLRRRANAPFRVLIVGRGPSAEVQKLGELPEVTVTGGVAEVGSYYRDAHAVIAPLRLGGGTRIKILEAFSHGVPVVATTTGAAGLEVADGASILLADSPEAFAGVCAEVMADPMLRRRIAAGAFGLAAARYGTDAIRGALRRRYAEAGDRAPAG